MTHQLLAQKLQVPIGVQPFDQGSSTPFHVTCQLMFEMMAHEVQPAILCWCRRVIFSATALFAMKVMEEVVVDGFPVGSFLMRITKIGWVRKVHRTRCVPPEGIFHGILVVIHCINSAHVLHRNLCRLAEHRCLPSDSLDAWTCKPRLANAISTSLSSGSVRRTCRSHTWSGFSIPQNSKRCSDR